MWGYVVKRILWVIPSLFIIASIFFVVSKNTNKDPIQAYLELQGITQFSSPNYYDLYEEEYKRSKQDYPSYYFSFVPNNYPKNGNAIINPNRRSWFSNLYNKGFHKQSILDYEKLVNKIDSDTTQEIYNIKSFTPDEIIASSHFTSFQKVDKEELMRIYKSKRKILIPAFYWHGTNNQFHHWIFKFLSGDWGVSYLDGSKVKDKVAQAFKWTSSLGLLTFIALIMIGIPLSVYSIYKKGVLSKLTEATSMFFYITPMFLLATLVQVFFMNPEYGMQLFPSYRTEFIKDLSFFERIGTYGTRYLPAIICIVITYLALFIRLLKSNILKENTLPYIKTAFSKGQNKWKVMTNHILPNVLIPIITLIIGMIPGFIGGSLIIEVIFNIPGMGRLMYNSIQLADWSVVYYMVILFGLIITLSYLLGDLLTAWINPKINFTNTEMDV